MQEPGNNNMNKVTLLLNTCIHTGSIVITLTDALTYKPTVQWSPGEGEDDWSCTTSTR